MSKGRGAPPHASHLTPLLFMWKVLIRSQMEGNQSTVTLRWRWCLTTPHPPPSCCCCEAQMFHMTHRCRSKLLLKEGLGSDRSVILNQQRFIRLREACVKYERASAWYTTIQETFECVPTCSRHCDPPQTQEFQTQEFQTQTSLFLLYVLIISTHLNCV